MAPVKQKVTAFDVPSSPLKDAERKGSKTSSQDRNELLSVKSDLVQAVLSSDSSGHRNRSKSVKAAKLVAAGLPWPDEPQIAHETRRLVQNSEVPWHCNEDINEKYEFVSSLGTGGFAKVFKGRNKQTDEDVAIKKIETTGEEGDLDVVYKEIKHLTMLKDVKQVVGIYEVWETASDVCIVMELCKGGELHSSFESQGRAQLTYGDVGRIAVCMLILADAMHARGFVHCDLKPENFCLAEPLDSGVAIVDSLRLIDFGLSQRVRGGQAIAGLAGSIPYMAPEIKSRMYDHKVDIWSIGVIIYTLLVGSLPFDGRSAEEIMARAATRKPDTSSLHPAVADFVNWLLTKDPRKRPEARTAMQHPWLKSTTQKTEGKDAVLQSVSNEVLQNLSIFAASNKLQRAFMHLAAGFMGKTEMQKMLDMFHTLATDKKKPLNADQIKALLAEGKSSQEVERVNKTVDLVMGLDGELSVEDFIVASMNQYRNLSDAVIKTMFKTLDKDNDGWVTAEDAYDALQSVGIHIGVKELTKLFEKYGIKRRLGDATTSTSGLMTYHEFHELMMPSVSQRYTHDLDNVLTAFKTYERQNPFQKLARRIVAEHAPATKEIEKIKRAFHNLDVDGTGTLTKKELAEGVRKAGYVVSDADVNRLFDELDTDGTGLVRYHEFVAGAIDQSLLVGDNLLHWVFDYMDDDDTSTINATNLKVITELRTYEREHVGCLPTAVSDGVNGVHGEHHATCQASLLSMLDIMDWSEGEKKKIWCAACGEGDTCDLTFEQFRALIAEEGGNLLARVAAGASVVQHDTGVAPPRVVSERGQQGSSRGRESSNGASASGQIGVAELASANGERGSGRGGTGAGAVDAADGNEGEEDDDDDDDEENVKLLTIRQGRKSRPGERSLPDLLKEAQRRHIDIVKAAHDDVGACAPALLPGQRSASGGSAAGSPPHTGKDGLPATQGISEHWEHIDSSAKHPLGAVSVPIDPLRPPLQSSSSSTVPLGKTTAKPAWHQPSNTTRKKGIAGRVWGKFKKSFKPRE